jgi:hypothetical protein
MEGLNCLLCDYICETAVLGSLHFSVFQGGVPWLNSAYIRRIRKTGTSNTESTSHSQVYFILKNGLFSARLNIVSPGSLMTLYQYKVVV